MSEEQARLDALRKAYQAPEVRYMGQVAWDWYYYSTRLEQGILDRRGSSDTQARSPRLANEMSDGLRALLARVMPEQNVAAVTTARTADGRIWCAVREGGGVRVWQAEDDDVG